MSARGDTEYQSLKFFSPVTQFCSVSLSFDMWLVQGMLECFFPPEYISGQNLLCCLSRGNIAQVTLILQADI